MPIDYCAHIAADSDGLATAAADHLDAEVEHCPGWRVADLVRHVFQVHAFWGLLVERGLTDPKEADAAMPPMPADDELIEQFRANAAHLVGVLRAADPATPVWTWASRQDAGFVIRHQVQEAAVHRWDAEHAAGHPFAIDPVAAADSIEEFLHCSLGRRSAETPALDGSLTVTETDTDRSWTLTEDGDRLAVAETNDGPATTELRGCASDVLLWLYQRLPTSRLTVTGPAEVADRFAGYAGTD
jgi:uncharacterized protein (TIGR03083 family)